MILKFSVRRHSSVDINDAQIRSILTLASTLVTDECKKAARFKSARDLRTMWCDVDFQLRGDVRPMEPLPDAVLRRNGFTGNQIAAVRVSETHGLFGRDAVQGVIVSAKQADGLQIYLVKSIVAPCPDRFDKAGQGFTVLKAKRRRREDPHPWMGCSENSGYASVIRPVAIDGPRDNEWLRDEAVLWAHELAHLLGLDDLDEGLSRALPQGGPGWLMMHPYRAESTRLLPHECDVIMHYPENKAQGVKLEEWLKAREKRHSNRAGAT